MGILMKYKILVIIPVGLLLNGCGLFPTVYYDSSSSAYDIAQHNYQILLNARDNRKDYLLVDSNGITTPKNIFLYINGLREPLEKYKLSTENLIQYNKQIMTEIRKKNDN